MRSTRCSERRRGALLLVTALSPGAASRIDAAAQQFVYSANSIGGIVADHMDLPAV